MEYREVPPSPELAEQIECFWLLTGTGASGESEAQRVLPDGCPELIFNFGDPFQRLLENGRTEKQGRALVAGQLERAIRIRPTGAVRLLGLRFRPGGAHRFLGFPQNELTGRIQELEAVAGMWARPLISEVLDARTRGEAKAALERVLVRRRRERTEAEQGVEKAVDAILASGGMVLPGRLAEAMGISGRQLARRFERVVGLGPKRFCRIIRFQQVFRRVERGERVSWAAVAAECGYYDQAHLIKDFKEFSGETPPALFLQDSPLTYYFTRRNRVTDSSKPDSWD